MVFFISSFEEVKISFPEVDDLEFCTIKTNATIATIATITILEELLLICV